MKKLIITTVVLLLHCLSFAQGIQFDESNSWKSVQEKAMKENKLIFIDFYATWCGPCKVMDQQVYTRQEVGDAINKDFVSVKVQTDKTDKDSELIKAWYGDAAKLAARYNVQVLPTLLFVKPDGSVLNSSVGGSTNIDKFIATAKDALNPDAHYGKLKSDFRSGKLELEKYPLLENKANSSGEPEFSLEVQKAYKARFFDKMTERELLKPEHLKYLFDHPNFMNSKDRLFKIAFSASQKIDQSLKGQASGFVSEIIKREEFTNKLWNNEEPVTPTPDWNAIESSIKNKYGQKYVDELLFSNQYAFYSRLGDWKSAIKIIDDRNAHFPIKANDVNGAWDLNQFGWEFFSFYDDKEALAAAIKWVDLAINAVGDENQEVHNFYDTKANLLHKMGRTTEAIVLEKKAVNLKEKLGGGRAEYGPTLEKMEKGLPTWGN